MAARDARGHSARPAFASWIPIAAASSGTRRALATRTVNVAAPARAAIPAGMGPVVRRRTPAHALRIVARSAVTAAARPANRSRAARATASAPARAARPRPPRAARTPGSNNVSAIWRAPVALMIGDPPALSWRTPAARVRATAAPSMDHRAVTAPSVRAVSASWIPSAVTACGMRPAAGTREEPARATARIATRVAMASAALARVPALALRTA